MIKKSNYLFENRISQHFLYNSLNSVASLCRTDPEAAAELVIEISTFMQKSLETKAPLITLKDELEHVTSYINIQKTRFSNRLEISLDIEENIDCLMPSFTLQPIVDNAIIHGVLKRRQGGTVLLSVQGAPQGVQFKITDSGVGMTTDQLTCLLDNRSSLFQIDHNLKAHGFDGLIINSKEGQGTDVSFTIPCSISP